MFDKLVESASAGAELGPRRRIFVASFFFVAILFAATVVASIYAADFDLGNDNFDIAQLLSPIAETESPPVQEPQPQPRNSNLPRSANDEFVRPVLMASTDDFTKVPDKPSSEVNPYASIPVGKYANVRVGSVPADPGPGGGTGGSEIGSGSGIRDLGTEVPETKAPPPAPPIPEKKTTVVSGGVMTGKAKQLPKPTYSAAAKAVGAQGTVTVQILVDETGKVVSAKAANGHPLLRPAAVEAALKARFDPTTLSGVPVKVTGIINYNFTK